MITWNFDKQVVVITGGTSGLGYALTESFLQSGAKVYSCGMNDTKLTKAREALAATYKYGSFDLAAVDVSDTNKLKEWLQMIQREEQRIDVLINAAGVCSTVPAAEVDAELWDRIMEVNVKGTFFACQMVAEFMKERGYGRIVNVSSISAYNGGTLVSPPYGASKAGVVALTKSFAALYSRYGINVNAISPGPFKTDMIADFTPEGVAGMISKTPDGRLGEVSDIVQSVLFLSDQAASHITGATLDINGGLYMR
ncbi:SDR family NAD(P)-dependent oxidoreductase [Paenibacillus agricola]|uniref:SDR family oxidoreductase n=1 Tax=Paenibacillus agricola TaxID=2716264 RepID=A0ABX0IYV6_9BACL|nr:SDR family oxidoreductase [Paenibacillus agricola]NHN29167.1 SDR family oxidoreductase [Paenibacillus agricola]